MEDATDMQKNVVSRPMLRVITPEADNMSVKTARLYLNTVRKGCSISVSNILLNAVLSLDVFGSENESKFEGMFLWCFWPMKWAILYAENHVTLMNLKSARERIIVREFVIFLMCCRLFGRSPHTKVIFDLCISPLAKSKLKRRVLVGPTKNARLRQWFASSKEWRKFEDEREVLIKESALQDPEWNALYSNLRNFVHDESLKMHCESRKINLDRAELYVELAVYWAWCIRDEFQRLWIDKERFCDLVTDYIRTRTEKRRKLQEVSDEKVQEPMQGDWVSLNTELWERIELLQEQAVSDNKTFRMLTAAELVLDILETPIYIRKETRDAALMTVCSMGGADNLVA